MKGENKPLFHLKGFLMTVKVLGMQSDIQYQGVQDKSEADPRDALLNIVFVGQFKRGRVDRPFKVTQQDYRAKLGFDPKNKDYMAIEDALTDGAPFVWVQRVNERNIVDDNVKRGYGFNFGNDFGAPSK